LAREERHRHAREGKAARKCLAEGLVLGTDPADTTDPADAPLERYLASAVKAFELEKRPQSTISAAERSMLR
jgi:hypothetical protein